MSARRPWSIGLPCKFNIPAIPHMFVTPLSVIRRDLHGHIENHTAANLLVFEDLKERIAVSAGVLEQQNAVE
jgi:hypothetical protein